MKDNKDHIDLIERYLDEDLTREELEMFSRKLKEDTEFSQLYYEMDRFVEGIRRSASQTSMEEKLARLEQSLPVKKNQSEGSGTQVRRLWRGVRDYKYAIAASISVLIAAAIIFFNPFYSGKMGPVQLADMYFEPFENAGGGIKRSADEEKELLQEALLAYDQGNYVSAIGLFNEIPVTDENRLEVLMYAGNAYLATGQTAQAKEMFTNIIEDNMGLVIQAKWYLSLCYLKEGDVVNARPLLEEIESTGKYNKSDDAAEILDKLEK